MEVCCWALVIFLLLQHNSEIGLLCDLVGRPFPRDDATWRGLTQNVMKNWKKKNGMIWNQGVCNSERGWRDFVLLLLFYTDFVPPTLYYMCLSIAFWTKSSLYQQFSFWKLFAAPKWNFEKEGRTVWRGIKLQNDKGSSYRYACCSYILISARVFAVWL